MMEERRCSEARKVTAGHASQTLWFVPSVGSGMTAYIRTPGCDV